MTRFVLGDQMWSKLELLILKKEKLGGTMKK